METDDGDSPLLESQTVTKMNLDYMVPIAQKQQNNEKNSTKIKIKIYFHTLN